MTLTTILDCMSSAVSDIADAISNKAKRKYQIDEAFNKYEVAATEMRLNIMSSKYSAKKVIFDINKRSRDKEKLLQNYEDKQDQLFVCIDRLKLMKNKLFNELISSEDKDNSKKLLNCIDIINLRISELLAIVHTNRIDISEKLFNICSAENQEKKLLEE